MCIWFIYKKIRPISQKSLQVTTTLSCMAVSHSHANKTYQTKEWKKLLLLSLTKMILFLRPRSKERNMRERFPTNHSLSFFHQSFLFYLCSLYIHNGTLHSFPFPSETSTLLLNLRLWSLMDVGGSYGFDLNGYPWFLCNLRLGFDGLDRVTVEGLTDLEMMATQRGKKTDIGGVTKPSRMKMEKSTGIVESGVMLTVWRFQSRF